MEIINPLIIGEKIGLDKNWDVQFCVGIANNIISVLYLCQYRMIC